MASRIPGHLLALLFMMTSCAAQTNNNSSSSSGTSSSLLPVAGVTSAPMTSSVTSLTNVTSSTCTLTLANNVTYAAARQLFLDVAQGYKVIVYFRLLVAGGDGIVTSSFDVGGADTFEPDVWVWATSKGKNLLRMPLDYRILSLGLLTLNTAHMNITIDSESANCMRTKSYSETADVIARFLAVNLTGNGSLATPDGPVVCRSAFAFSHHMFGQRGIGFSCCSTPSGPQHPYDCSTHYTDSWELVWYGPVALLLWVYLIAFVHFYKLYRNQFVKSKLRRLAGVTDTIEDIKRDVVSRIVEISKRIARIRDVNDLIALREDCSYLDILGVEKSMQSRITAALTIVVVFLLVSAYYIAYALFVYEYKLQINSKTYDRLNDTQTVFLNVIGHFGWLFCRPEKIYLFRYAVFEAIYTLLLPVFVAAVWGSIALRSRAKVVQQALSSKLPDAVQRAQSVRDSACRGRLIQFGESTVGQFVMGVCLFLVVVYVIFLAGPFVMYVSYFSGLGVFANIDVVSPWIIPIVICLHFFMTSFDPVSNLYQRIKDMFFSACLQHHKDLVIKRQNEIFLPRDLIFKFYVPLSRPAIYSSVLRIMWTLAFVILLILVILTIQFPYYNQTDSIVSFLGVQVVFILPLLAQLMSNGRSITSLEEGILQGDIDEYIRNHIAKMASKTTNGGGAGGGDQNGGGANPAGRRSADGTGTVVPAVGFEGTDADPEEVELGVINDGYGIADGNIDFGDVVASTGQKVLAGKYSNPFRFLPNGN